MLQALLPPTFINVGKVMLGENILWPLRSNVDVSAARELTLDVRIRDLTLSGGSGTAPSLALLLQPSAPQGDGKIWTLNSAVVTATVAAQAAIAEGLYRGSSSGAVGGLVNLILSYTQYTAGTPQVYFTVSADLVQKA